MWILTQFLASSTDMMDFFTKTQHHHSFLILVLKQGMFGLIGWLFYISLLGFCCTTTYLSPAVLFREDVWFPLETDLKFDVYCIFIQWVLLNRSKPLRKFGSMLHYCSNCYMLEFFVETSKCLISRFMIFSFLTMIVLFIRDTRKLALENNPTILGRQWSVSVSTCGQNWSKIYMPQNPKTNMVPITL